MPQRGFHTLIVIKAFVQESIQALGNRAFQTAIELPVLQELEAGVDAEKVAAFLSVDGESSNQMVTAQPSAQNAESVPRESEMPPAPNVSRTPELWTSRTIRLRQSTANGLTVAACGQKGDLYLPEPEPAPRPAAPAAEAPPPEGPAAGKVD